MLDGKRISNVCLVEYQTDLKCFKMYIDDKNKDPNFGSSYPNRTVVIGIEKFGCDVIDQILQSNIKKLK